VAIPDVGEEELVVELADGMEVVEELVIGEYQDKGQRKSKRKGEKMNWVTIIKTILTLLPAIIDAIKAIETAIPISGKGAEKITAVKEIIVDVNKHATELWPHIEKTINILVRLFNSTGIFKTKK